MRTIEKRFEAVQQKIHRLQGQKERTETNLKRSLQEKSVQEERLEDIKKALEIVYQVAKETQDQLEYKVSELATLALGGVLDSPYKLSLEFETKNNSTQAHILFERDGEKIHPLLSSGGGAVDIASLALQMTMWSISRPRKRNILVLDEPLKWLKGKDMPIKGALMLREMSHRLGVQVFMVSHGPELIDGADNVIEVTYG